MRTAARREAMDNGQNKYFTGKACRAGHLAERYVANGHCVLCQSASSKTTEARKKQAMRRVVANEYQREYYKSWVTTNREAKLEYMKKYSREVGNPRLRHKYHNDPLTNVAIRLRARLSAILKAKKMNKTSKTEDFVGCGFDHLVRYIELMFKRGMSWENRSDWHIDHIIPLAMARNERELRMLFHYTNLQPLWAEENLKKGKRLVVIR